MLSFFPRGVLDEILNLIESVSEGFPSYFCSGKFQSPLTEHYPVLLCFLHFLLNPSVCFPVVFCFCFILLLLQVSPLIQAAFLPKYHTGCISHCCIVSGNHGIDGYVLIAQSNEWCVILMLAVPRQLFCFGSLVVSDVVFRYSCYILIQKIGKNRCLMLD